MGLITKEVPVYITKNKIYYYKRQGYICNAGDIINVKIEHLSSSEKIVIQYKCDLCGEIVDTKFSAFIRKHKIGDKLYCKKCANKIKNDKRSNSHITKDGLKMCVQCNRKLPANTDYFFKKCDTKDGFNNKCKECLGKKFTNYLTHIPKEGYKFCIKCDRELPNTSQYFPIDKMCKNGLRNVCRKCGKDGHFMEDNYVTNDPWSQEDMDLLKSIYKDYTNEELVNNFFPNRTKHALDTQAYQLGFAFKTEETYKRSCIQRGIKCSKKLKGRKLSPEICAKLSKIRKEYFKTHHGTRLGAKATDETKLKMSLVVKARGYWKGINNPRHLNPLNGELNGNWQGGITGLYYELRSETKVWRQESMEFCNYHCVLTGGNFDNVHHLKPFKQIVEEAFQITKLDKRQKVLDYTDDEFKNLRKVLDNLHNEYGYGVCLCKSIHKLFHDTYGYTNNTYNQFLDFVSRLEFGEFNQWLEDNNLKLNINYQVINYIKGLIPKGI